MIQIKNLSKTYHSENGNRAPVQALFNVNMSIRDREFVSIIGPSGCGKTTLLKIIAGLIPFDDGEVIVDGKPVEGPGQEGCSMVFQSFALLPWRTVLGNIEFGLELRGRPKKERVETAMHFIDRVGLGGFAHHYPFELSGGMQQRAGLARALAVNPSILLMDEPFGALDAQTRKLLQEQLLRMWEEQRKTVVFVTHSMEEAVYLSDRVIVLKPRPGQVVEIMDVPLQRPRVNQDVWSSPEFARLNSYLWDLLKSVMETEEEKTLVGQGVGVKR